MILDATNKSINIVLGGAVTTTQWDITAAYEDLTSTTFKAGSTDTVSNSTTTVIVVASPAVFTQRRVKFMSIYNADTAVGTVTVQYVDGASTRIVAKIALNPGESLIYMNGVWSIPTAVTNDTIRYATDQSTLTSAQAAYAMMNLQAASGVMVNGVIVESHAGNAATFALKGLNGSNPSATNPVLVAKQDSGGGYFLITSALSITISSGSTMGAVNSVAFNLWFCLINDGGTTRLGVRNCVLNPGVTGTGAVSGFPTNNLISSTAEGGAGGADTAGVTYTDSAVSNKGFSIIGHMEYDSGLAAVGTWGTSPSRWVGLTHFSKLPGDPIKVLVNASATAALSTSTTMATSGMSYTFTPSHAANPMLVRWFATGDLVGVVGMNARIFRGATGIGPTTILGSGGAGTTTIDAQLGGEAFDVPNTASSMTYAVFFKTIVAGQRVDINNQSTVASDTTGGTIVVEELQG